MPNYCNYSMKIKGTKANCKEFHERMEDYDKPNHFYRIFDAYINNEGGTDDDYFMEVSGDCAWSIESCCRASGYSGGIDLISANTKELDLIFEVYSEEPGMEFQEHYIYEKGNCITDECVKWEEYWWDQDEYPTIEKFAEEYGLGNITEDDLDDGEYYHTGGFESWNFII